MTFHINPKTGRVGKCSAEQACPFGGAGAHSPTREAAQEALEELLRPLTLPSPGKRKPLPAVGKGKQPPVAPAQEANPEATEAARRSVRQAHQEAATCGAPAPNLTCGSPTSRPQGQPLPAPTRRSVASCGSASLTC